MKAETVDGLEVKSEISTHRRLMQYSYFASKDLHQPNPDIIRLERVGQSAGDVRP